MHLIYFLRFSSARPQRFESRPVDFPLNESINIFTRFCTLRIIIIRPQLSCPVLSSVHHFKNSPSTRNSRIFCISRGCFSGIWAATKTATSRRRIKRKRPFIIIDNESSRALASSCVYKLPFNKQPHKHTMDWTLKESSSSSSGLGPTFIYTHKFNDDHGGAEVHYVPFIIFLSARRILPCCCSL